MSGDDIFLIYLIGLVVVFGGLGIFLLKLLFKYLKKK